MSTTGIIPLATQIPGNLISASLWNNEFSNVGALLDASGAGGYSSTDVQMQIQTNPFPGSVTSHASNVAGELERIRFVIAQLTGTTYWYQPANLAVNSLAEIQVPLGVIVDYPVATPPNYRWLLANGQAVSRATYAAYFALVGTAFGVGDGSSTFNVPNCTDRTTFGAGNAYAAGQVGGSTNVSVTDPGHNHTQNGHVHGMPHKHQTPVFATGGATIGVIDDSVWPSGTLSSALVTDAVGTPSHPSPVNLLYTAGSNTADTGSTTPTNNGSTTGITATHTPPFIGLYKMIRAI